MMMDATTHGTHAPSEPAVDLLDFGRYAWRRAWMVVAAVFACVVAGLAYIAAKAPVYRATATLRVEPFQELIQRADGPMRDEVALEILKTVEQSITVPSLLLAVAKTNGTIGRADFLPTLQGPDRTDAKVADEFGKSVFAALRRGTHLVDVSVEHTDPALARDLANLLAELFLRKDVALRSSGASQSADLLREEAAGLRAKLEAAELTAQEFREQNRAVSLEEQQNIVVAKLQELNLKLTEAKAQRLRVESEYREVEGMHGNPEALLALPSVAEDPSIAKLIEGRAMAEVQVAEFGKRYLERHPKMIQAHSAVASWQRSLYAEAARVPDRLRVAWQSARANEAAVGEALHDQETLALALDKQAIRYRQLTREADAGRLLYEHVLRKLEESEATRQVQKSIAQVVQPAMLPDLDRPAAPRRSLVIALAAMAGLALGAGGLMLLYQFDNTVDTAEQVEGLIGLPVLADVPVCAEFDDPRDALVVVSRPTGPEAEAFRTLRTAVALLGPREDHRVCLFASASPFDGKTFCSANTAAAWAQQGLRTVIVDFDLRRPSVRRMFPEDAPAHAPGVVDCLVGEAVPQDCCRSTAVPNLWVFPAGAPSPNPGELLATAPIDTLISWLAKEFERVVIDSPPVNLVSDSLLIADSVQFACLVVRAGKTDVRALRLARRALESARVRVSGVVLNGARRISRSSGPYYHYYAQYTQGQSREDAGPTP